MAESCGEPYDSSDEYNRDERIETIYQGWGAREMAERIVDLEDELGADVDGVCTGMHADVAEAHAEVERLTSLVGHWEHRAEDAERADRYRGAWQSARRRASRVMGAWRHATRAERAAYEEMGKQDEFARTLWEWLVERRQERDRYRLAWLSARRRAADEANMGMEALDLVRRDRDGWMRGHERAEAQLVRERRANAALRAELDDLRKSTSGAPRLESMGSDEGDEVWRLSAS